MTNYLLKSSAMFYGLSRLDVWKLSKSYSKKIKTVVPKSWLDNKMACRHWIYEFMKRHCNLSPRNRNQPV